MFSLGENSRVLGAGHLILNVLRALTLVGLAIVMTAHWAMIILSIMKGHFDFFDFITHFFVFLIAILLFVSELNLRWFASWYERNWPVLCPGHSFAWLGVALVIIGCQILGDLVKPAYSTETIGLAFWRVIVAAGILSLTFGFFNIIASIVFRVPERDITARQIRSQGSLASQSASGSKSIDDSFSQDYSSAHRDNFSARGYFKEMDAEGPARLKRLTKAYCAKTFRKSRIQISKPIPQDTMDCERGLDRASPIMPDVQRPPTGLHPALNPALNRSSGSRYSEANMSRF
ncbi:hypothetical protein BT67DRAFT_433056 [Trichocladium antarcticum]|uniref:DUF7598 domain-containing protein n=1 Tax=Trichocladium antarcticum TaxID=1450529 RepID=A0AAN6UM38_9PEZI|nr:hypothetical protein BT67DRAFT_433056 [Trichocladium antarcticum]